MLEELKVNSRPHLTTLTILAGEYRQYALQVIFMITDKIGISPPQNFKFFLDCGFDRNQTAENAKIPVTGDVPYRLYCQRVSR